MENENDGWNVCELMRDDNRGLTRGEEPHRPHPEDRRRPSSRDQSGFVWSKGP